MPGPRHKGPQGPKPKIKNPGKLFMRLLKTVMKRYAFAWIVVFAGTILAVLANIQGTLFIQSLIDKFQ